VRSEETEDALEAFFVGYEYLICGTGKFVHRSYHLGRASHLCIISNKGHKRVGETSMRPHLWYPLWTDKTPCLDYPRTCAAQSVNEPYFDIRRYDCFLILKPIPGTHFDNFHGNSFASCGRIGALPRHGKRYSRARDSKNCLCRTKSCCSCSKRHVHLRRDCDCVLG